MSPKKIPYRAPEEVCRFFERLRASIDTSLPTDLRALHRANEAETRSGGSTKYKRHLHTGRLNDLKRGFYYVLWPDDLGRLEGTGALGLYVSFEPFEKGLDGDLSRMLRQGELGKRVAGLGFDTSPDLPRNPRDETTGSWVAKGVVDLDWPDLDFADDYGQRLAGLMAVCHPVVRDLVEQSFPQLLKER